MGNVSLPPAACTEIIQIHSCSVVAGEHVRTSSTFPLRYFRNSVNLVLSSFFTAQQMVYLYPRVYNCSVPSAFLADLPPLAQLCEGSKPPLADYKRVEELVSVQGDKFVSFAKSERFVDGERCIIYT